MNGEEVIDLNTSPRTVHKEFDHILACRVVDRVSVNVLREDLLRDQLALVLVFEFVVGCHRKGGKDRAVTDLLLHDFVAINLGGDIRHAVDVLVTWDQVNRALPLLQLLHLTN